MISTSKATVGAENFKNETRAWLSGIVANLEYRGRYLGSSGESCANDEIAHLGQINNSTRELRNHGRSSNGSSNSTRCPDI